MTDTRRPSIVNPQRGADSQGPSPNLEQYVETIAYLLTQDKVCTVSEIAELANVTRPAASRAVKELADKELVTHRSYGYVDLTEDGAQLARQLTERHETLRLFLQNVLLFDADTADQEACRLEHQVDDELARRIQALTELLSPKRALLDKLRDVLGE